MMRVLKRWGRFLADQSFFPIALASLYSLGLYSARVLTADNRVVYSNLVWNLFLAWVPYLFSILADGLDRLYPRRWGLLIAPGVVWLLFIPNAPYILTDFFHLEARPGIPLWYDMLLLIAFSWSGIFLMVASLRTMQRLVRGYLGWLLSWFFALVALLLCGVGIYLGRFERWNSWDMLSHPRRILVDVLAPMTDPLNSLRYFGVTILFASFLLICYLVFVSMDRPDVAEESSDVAR